MRVELENLLENGIIENEKIVELFYEGKSVWKGKTNNLNEMANYLSIGFVKFINKKENTFNEANYKIEIEPILNEGSSMKKIIKNTKKLTDGSLSDDEKQRANDKLLQIYHGKKAGEASINNDKHEKAEEIGKGMDVKFKNTKETITLDKVNNLNNTHYSKDIKKIKPNYEYKPVSVNSSYDVNDLEFENLILEDFREYLKEDQTELNEESLNEGKIKNLIRWKLAKFSLRFLSNKSLNEFVSAYYADKNGNPTEKSKEWEAKPRKEKIKKLRELADSLKQEEKDKIINSKVSMQLENSEAFNDSQKTIKAYKSIVSSLAIMATFMFGILLGSLMIAGFAGIAKVHAATVLSRDNIINQLTYNKKMNESVDIVKDNNKTTDILNNLRKDIQGEYDAIIGYDARADFAEANGYLDISTILRNIRDEEKVHLGELNALLDKYDETFEKSTEDGKSEATEKM